MTLLSLKIWNYIKHDLIKLKINGYFLIFKIKYWKTIFYTIF